MLANRSLGETPMVGHLSRSNAIAYRPVIDRLAAEGKVAACHTRVTGGATRSDGAVLSFGVVLLVGTPEDMGRELDGD